MANQNPYGTLGVGATNAQPNLGEPQTGSLWTDIGEGFFGHAAYAPGGQFGGNNNTNQYAQGVSGIGAAQGQYDQQQGQQQANNLAGDGNLALGTFQGLGNAYAGVQAPQAQMQNANAAYFNQLNALGMYGQAAQGNGPSAAQAQLQSGLDQSMRAQQSQAASTRGGFGLANAQHDAGMNAAQLQGQAGNASAQLRAQEQQAAMAGYAGLGTQIQGQQAGNAFQQAGMNQQQLQANAQNQLAAYSQGQGASNALQLGGANLGLQYDQLGQNTAYGYNQLGQGALSNQLSADVAAQQSKQQAMSQNAQNSQKGVGTILSAIGGLF